MIKIQLQLTNQVGVDLGEQLWIQYKEQITDRIWNQLRSYSWRTLRGQLGVQLDNLIYNQLWNNNHD